VRDRTPARAGFSTARDDPGLARCGGISTATSDSPRPDLYLGKAVSDDDCGALASDARNRLQSDRDHRCQDGRRHCPFYALRLLMCSRQLGGHFSPAQPKSRAELQHIITTRARRPLFGQSAICETGDAVKPSWRSDRMLRNAAYYSVTLAKAASGGQLGSGWPPSLSQASAPVSAAWRRSIMCCVSLRRPGKRVVRVRHSA
jgi:hypothetical protein